MAELGPDKPFGNTAEPSERRRLGVTTLLVFFATFILTRIIIGLDMLHDGPDIHLQDDRTHVHHFVYGIGLLTVVGGYLLFGRPGALAKRIAAIVYGFGLALAFDEFGMWFKLKDLYWQRISYEAVSLITGILAFIAFFPQGRDRRSWRISALTGACILLTLSLIYAFGLLRDHYGQKLKVSEEVMQRASALQTPHAPSPPPSP